ncbi:MAG: S-methyl-5-thioribose-1-phosphate isomerase [Zoogloeaceae bacterium]|jgi:methylthioribose-1-phosphate isomerase|nr:S-methyl-5-thioribose-1-phosphate isomerase [Zoogloeaceae bacterium]
MTKRLFTLREVDDAIVILDQSALPHAYVTRTLRSLADVAEAIRAMRMRGAPLIGVTAAYGLALALKEDADTTTLERAIDALAATRPTAVNLRWALDRMRARLLPLPAAERRAAAWTEARAIAAEDAAANQRIGQHGLALLRQCARRPVRLMTHCNAGWLAATAWGTALAPVYAAHAAGIDTHVWASETRPRNQGLLTAWELREAGIPHTLIADNAAGHLLRAGEVDLVIVGADRIAANGDTANKIGTCLKALAAADCGVPFYVAAPRSTIDLACPDGAHIPIEERDGGEVRRVDGLDHHGDPATLTLAADATPVANPAFDITPARLITGILTEDGLCDPATPGALRAFFEESK